MEQNEILEEWRKEIGPLKGRIFELVDDRYNTLRSQTLVPYAVLYRIPSVEKESRRECKFPENRTSWPFESDSFDYVLIPVGMERISDLEGALQESYRILKPGGKLIGLSLPHIPTFNIDQYERRPTNKEQILIDCAVKIGFRRPQWNGTSVWDGDRTRVAYFTATKYVRLSSMVSVVILCHNQAHYLRRALHAALAQTYSPYEIIVVNNGSSDGSDRILTEFDHQVKIITREKGIPGAINAGFQAAQGDYFTWTGADNVMFPHMLDVLATYLDSYGDVGAVYSDNALIDFQGSHLYSMHRPDYDPSLLLDVSRHWLIGISFMFRRDVFESVGGCDISLQYGEDYDLWLKIAGRCKVGHIPDNLVLMAYHDHSCGLSDRDKHRRRQALDYTRRKSLEISEKYLHQILEQTNAQI